MQESRQTQNNTDQDETIRVTVLIPKGLDRALEMRGAEKDITKSQMVADAIAAYLAKG